MIMDINITNIKKTIKRTLYLTYFHLLSRKLIFTLLSLTFTVPFLSFDHKRPVDHTLLMKQFTKRTHYGKVVIFYSIGESYYFFNLNEF